MTDTERKKVNRIIRRLRFRMHVAKALQRKTEQLYLVLADKLSK